MTYRDLSKITPDALRDWLETHGWKRGKSWPGYDEYVTHANDGTLTGFVAVDNAPQFESDGSKQKWLGNIADACGWDEWTDAYDAIVGRPAYGIGRALEGAAPNYTLREARRHVGLTQVVVAARMGVAQNAVSRIERQDEMRIATLRAYAAALGGELRMTINLPSGPIALDIGA